MQKKITFFENEKNIPEKNLEKTEFHDHKTTISRLRTSSQSSNATKAFDSDGNEIPIQSMGSSIVNLDRQLRRKCEKISSFLDNISNSNDSSNKEKNMNYINKIIVEMNEQINSIVNKDFQRIIFNKFQQKIKNLFVLKNIQQFTNLEMS